MKTLCVIVAVVFGLAMAAPLLAQSQDYKSMSNDQLYQLQKEGKIPVQDRAKFNAVWEQRVVAMNQDELNKYEIPYSKQEIEQMRMQRLSPQG